MRAVSQVNIDASVVLDRADKVLEQLYWHRHGLKILELEKYIEKSDRQRRLVEKWSLGLFKVKGISDTSADWRLSNNEWGYYPHKHWGLEREIALLHIRKACLTSSEILLDIKHVNLLW